MLAVLAAGCYPYSGYVSVVPAPRQLQIRGPLQVHTFLVTPPARPHVDIGMLWASSADTTVDQLIVVLRTTAGQHGCDALVITSLNVGRHGLSTAGRIDGSCEIYTDAAASNASQPSPAPNPSASTPPAEASRPAPR